MATGTSKTSSLRRKVADAGAYRARLQRRELDLRHHLAGELVRLHHDGPVCALVMSTDRVVEALHTIHGAIRIGLVEQQVWDRAEADGFAARFVAAVVDRMRTMPPATGVH